MEPPHAVDDACLAPFHYISETPGKDVRGALIDAFNQWLEIPSDKVDAIKSVVSRLHNASLLVDDIEDGSRLRRGQPVAHAIFGVPATLNAANYASAAAANSLFSGRRGAAAATWIFPRRREAGLGTRPRRRVASSVEAAGRRKTFARPASFRADVARRRREKGNPGTSSRSRSATASRAPPRSRSSSRSC